MAHLTRLLLSQASAHKSSIERFSMQIATSFRVKSALRPSPAAFFHNIYCRLTHRSVQALSDDEDEEKPRPTPKAKVRKLVLDDSDDE